MKLPDPVRRVADELSELPSIGPRQAIRLAFYLIAKNKEDVKNLAESIDALRNLKICERCFFVHQNQGNLCDICGNPNRRQGTIMIVEKETDLISLENTGKYTGRYLIIGEIAKSGVLEEWQKLRLQSLKNFITKELGVVPATSQNLSSENDATATAFPIAADSPSEIAPVISSPEIAPASQGKADEIILAFNPTTLGNLQSSLLIKELAPLTKRISRLGRGLPTGGEIEFADDETLGASLERRM